MKKLLILFILFIFLLSGCGIYNLNLFTLPDDVEFLALIQELDTPQKIGDYMLENFTYEIHLLNILTPYQLYVTQAGDCDDTANFAMFIANYHGYETYQIMIYQKNNIIKHCITIYRENGKYNFSDNQYYIFIEAANFKEIVEYDCYLRNKIWLKYTVYDYNMNIVEQVTK